MSMESSWNYDSGDKGFVLPNETVSPADFLNPRSENVLMNWGFKGSSYSYDDNSVFLLPGQKQPLENQGIMELGFPDMIRKQSSHDSLRNGFSNGSGGGDVINMHTITSNAISGDEESSSRLSNSVVDSNSRESSLIDLKLGRLGDNHCYNAESSTTAKRLKGSSLNSQPAFCQVYGCNKDLSSSKDYHKRHRVCDAHSKTAKVIVNGLEQRFCQQCSRFHLLGEFDDGKRSCRKRLAGHNERRRKTQVGLRSGRAGSLLHSYNGFAGTRPNRTRMTATAFTCQDIIPSSTVPPCSNNCRVIDLYRHTKSEQGPHFASKARSCWINGQLLQKPVFPPNLNGNSTTAAGVFNESNLNQYHPQAEDASSCSLLQNSLFNAAASTVEGLPELSGSGCALSLLSSQPYHDHHHQQQQQHHHHHSSGHPFTIPFNGNPATVGSDFTRGYFHGAGDGPTIDLLQLSTQLQRVEHQRQAVPVKQEDDTFCCLRIT